MSSESNSGTRRSNIDKLRRGASQIIALAAPPLTDLPCWGRRVEFERFFVELVPPGERVFNVRLTETFASINFAPADGTSSLAGDRLRRYERLPYEFIVVPPRFPLKGETKFAPEVLAFVIKFDRMRATLAEALGVAPNTLNPEVVIGGPETFTAELAKKIRRQLATNRPAPRYLESLCVALLVEMFKPIVERSMHKRRRRFDERKIGILLEYIDANLDGDLGIQQLANLVGASDHQFSRFFKNVVGESPHSYVIQRRTDAARHLLVNEDSSLADIAFATGFSSQSHMTTVLKKMLGITPAAIRQQI